MRLERAGGRERIRSSCGLIEPVGESASDGAWLGPLNMLCSTPARSAPAPAGACRCCHNFLCSPCATPAAPKEGPLAALPNEVLELIAEACGSDLGRFASVSRAMHGLARPTVWRHAYRARFDGDVEDEWGTHTLPPTLWRACLLREGGEKPM